MTVTVCRRMYVFHASLPDSRPPPVSFFAAERSTDFGSAGSDIHVGDAAIAAASAEERLGRRQVLVKIAEERPCGTSLCHAMASSSFSNSIR